MCYVADTQLFCASGPLEGVSADGCAVAGWSIPLNGVQVLLRVTLGGGVLKRLIGHLERGQPQPNAVCDGSSHIRDGLHAVLVHLQPCGEGNGICHEALLRVEAAQQVRFSLVEVVLILCFSVCEHIGMIVPILFQQHGLALTKLTLGRFVIKEVVVRCADKLLHEIAGFLPVAGKSLQSGSLRQANDRRAKVSGDIHMIAVHHRTNRVRLRPWLSPVQNAHVFVQNVEACLVVCESLFSFYHFLIHFLLLLSAFSSSCVQNPGKR